MGYFNDLIESGFKRDKDGNTVYYPWGILGKGWIITDKTAKTKIRQLNKLLYIVMMPLIFAGILVMKNQWMFLVLPFILGLFHFSIRRILADCPYSTESFSTVESNGDPAMDRGDKMLGLGFAATIIATFLSLSFILAADTQREFIAGIFPFALCLLTCLLLGYMIAVKETR